MAYFRPLADTNFINDANLVSYWKLEDTSDSKGNNTLTNNNSVVFNSAKFANGADFGTSNSNKSLSIASNLGISNSAITMSCWVKLSSEIGSGSWSFFAHHDSSSYTKDYIWYDYNGGARKIIFSHTKNFVGGADVEYTINMGTTNWYYLSMTYDGTNLYTYVNGAYVGTSSTTGVGNTLTYSGTIIGAKFIDNGSGVNCNASAIIDDTAIFSRALSSAEISALYQGKSIDLTIEIISILDLTLGRIITRIFSEILNMIDNTLGLELAVNGSFSADTNWTKETGWTILTGVATATAIANAAIYENIGTIGKYYEITYTISGYVAGGLAIKAGTATGTIRQANGTYTERIYAVGNGNMGIVTSSIVTTASIDNISIKEVTFAGFTWLNVIAKTYNETISMLDTVIRITTRVLSEIITNTAIGTGLKVTFKILTEIISTLDLTLGRIITRIFNEITSLTDIVIKISNRILSETISLTDTFIKTMLYCKTFLENISILDIINNLTKRLFSEITTIIATFSSSKLWNRIYTETITLTDSIIRTWNKILSESITLVSEIIIRLNGIVTNLWSKVARTIDSWNKTPRN